jgi:hypothetical protein
MLKEVRLETAKQVKALSQQTDLAYQRSYGGVTPYREVLYSGRQLFESELRLTRDRANEFLAVTALYRALGRGWQTQDAPGTSPRQNISNYKNYLLRLEKFWYSFPDVIHCPDEKLISGPKSSFIQKISILLGPAP